MFNKLTKLVVSHKFLKFLFISPILLSVPLLPHINEAKAGLEFQWDQDSGLRRLRWFQTDNKRRFRNTIYFFLRPSDRTAGLLKINLAIPYTFKANLKEEKISFCKVRIGGFDSRTKCLETVPADIVIKEDNSSVEIFPYSPIPSNKDSYGIVLKVVNPNRSGLFQFHTYGQYVGKSVMDYLGSSTIVLDD